MKPEIQKALQNIFIVIEQKASYKSGAEHTQIIKDFNLIKNELESKEGKPEDKVEEIEKLKG